jgi:hypothetical protein
MQQDAFERPQESLANHLVAPDHQGLAGLEPEIFRGHVIAYELDVARVSDAKAPFVGHSQERDRQRVEPHQLCGDCVNCYRVGGSEDQVLDARNHRAWPGAVAGDRSVHHGEHRRVQLALHVQEIDEHFVHVLVRVVTHFAQQASECVLDGARHHGMTVGLHGWEVQNLPPRIDRGNLNALREDLVQLQERTLEAVDLPGDLRQGSKSEPVPCEHRFPSVIAAAFPRVGHDGLVLDRNDAVALESIPEHGPHHAVHLPRL